MGQDTGSQQLLPSADTCVEMGDRCILSSAAAVPQERTPVSASQTCHPSLGRFAGSSLSLSLSLGRLEHGSLGTNLVNFGLQVSRQTVDQPAEPAHNLCERPFFACPPPSRGLPAPAARLDCWSRSRRRSTSPCRVFRRSVRSSIRTHFRSNHDQALWRRKPWRMFLASPKS